MLLLVFLLAGFIAESKAKQFKRMALGGLCIVILLLAGAAAAQSGGSFEISTSTIDNGGRYSGGGSYWVGGTIGQADSGVTLYGGSFDLIGGFWQIKEQHPTAVRLLARTVVSEIHAPWMLLAATLLLAGILVVRRKHN